MFCRLLQLSALALAAGLGAAPAGAQGVQGVYVCNDTSDPVAWKVYCGGTSTATGAGKWVDDLLADAKKVPLPSYVGKGRPGGLLRQPESRGFTQEEWEASFEHARQNPRLPPAD